MFNKLRELHERFSDWNGNRKMFNHELEKWKEEYGEICTAQNEFKYLLPSSGNESYSEMRNRERYEEGRAKLREICESHGKNSHDEWRIISESENGRRCAIGSPGCMR